MPASLVIGGTINLESPLVVRVEKVGADTVLSGIVRLLDRALAEKPRLAQIADRVAGWFVFALLLVAASVAGIWYCGRCLACVLDHCFRAGGVLPVRAGFGHAGGVDGGIGASDPAGIVVHPRPCAGNPGARDRFRLRQDRHADHRPVQPAGYGSAAHGSRPGSGVGARAGTGRDASAGGGVARSCGRVGGRATACQFGRRTI